MSYEVVFSDSADKQLSKLSIGIQRRTLATIKRCRIRPYAHVKKVVGSKYFRLRAGDYRVIMDICDGALVIHVIEVGHRKKVYKRRS